MVILNGWNLQLDVDQILRGQGADPAVIRTRSPRLVEVAARVLEEGRNLIRPAVAYRRMSVRALHHEKLLLEDDGVLSGPLIAAQLAPAQQVVLIVCTVGDMVERRVAQAIADDPVYALALDGLGTAAVEALVAAVCQHFDGLAAQSAMQTTIPISPGMAGWEVDVGQREIFSLVDVRPIGVMLNAASQMIPRKSASLVIGIGPGVRAGDIPCDFCSMRDTCRYRDHTA